MSTDLPVDTTPVVHLPPDLVDPPDSELATEPQPEPYIGTIGIRASDGPTLWAFLPRSSGDIGWSLLHQDSTPPDGVDAALVRGMLLAALERLEKPGAAA